jgi:hypothetical protein
VLALDDDYEKAGIADSEELLDALIKRLIQHYGLE